VRFFAGLLAVLFGLSSVPAWAAGKVALVIGNAEYQTVGRLANPVNDASDFAAALERVGFDVTLAIDLDFSGMHKALQTFSRAADGADMAVVYYAGHGLEIDNRNYLIPVDATLDSDRDVALQAISLDLVTQTVDAAKSLRMVVLDACRNNPFASRMVRSSASRQIGRGLADVEPTGATLVAYAARGGTVAADGSGRNSPFMAALLRNIEKPGLDVSLMFRKVRDEVLAATDNQQEPFVYGSLPGEEIYIVPPAEMASVPGEAPESPPADGEELAWSLVKQSRDPAHLRSFIETFKNGAHHDEAVALLVDVLSAPPTLPEPDPATEPPAMQRADAPSTPECYVDDVRPPDAWLALRSHPSDKTGRQLQKLLPGQRFIIEEEAPGAWYFVTLPDRTQGWVSWKVKRWIAC
jgi:hypothetical protein